MKTTQWLAVFALAVIGLASAAEAKDKRQPVAPVVLGGVNLDAYCKRYHGSSFRAVVRQNTATGWRCENFADAVYGISVQRACEDTYRARPIKARVIGANLPGNWRCVRQVGRPRPY